ncbi:MAG: sigma-70 family RNA polymerase sigma factor [Acidobacteriota bacterium]
MTVLTSSLPRTADDANRRADARAPADATDHDLVLRHRYGDAEAFDEIYARYAGLVYNLALRLSGRPAQAEDLAQEVFLRIHRHLARFQGRASLRTWIYRVTVNHCRSKLGRKRLFTRSIDAFYDEGDDGEEPRALQIADPSRGPEEHALAHDAARQVARALRQVKPVFREAVVLRDLEELRYEEIAEVLQIRIGTVRSRIARGRDQLRRILAADDGAND